MKTLKSIKITLLVSLTALLLVACGEQPAQQANTPAAPKVDVANVLYERITEWDQFTGRLQAPEKVTLVPRVSGYIESINFKEGALVQKGDVLFTIDSRVFTAEYERLKAELTSAISANQLAENDYERANKLFHQKAVSEELIDTRRSNMHQTAAAVASVKAALTSAQLNVEYTQVTAPITGRVSYANETAGNYVTAGQTHLTSLVSTSHMYAYFDIDEQTYLKYAALSFENKRQNPRLGNNAVVMALANETSFNHQGVIDFVDNTVDQQTGTIRVRANFANQENQLLPGLFARISIAGSESYDSILIDDKAIFTDLNNKFVLVVNDKNTLEYRSVSLGEKLHGLRIITAGLSPNDTIVVNSLQKVRPNVTIEPNLTDMADSEKLEALHQAQRLLDNQPLTARVADDASQG
ncbi:MULTISPECIES: efflux RND transporter periplasmic adaptor subunit [Shewanella]|jgi:multidrug efflux system membrane fusion protein|uniref:Efflux RND transporter periplasmic adaptor subunit n=1 Tax=Shewanella vesiculosa TaxID=518738 RepID=A0ABV0FW65_9GAMM|nr:MULTISPECIES: efflux RND transporter periplasmic adaptor subunit [Shewanella]NCQ45731.1 efflux RND transporter periplasmic adaptor subunit [Shewanella frigidimarina]MBB1322468.1 efflux RND transporter periplasmic adaptor subunit [Shewanella sp. SR43-8]NCO72402.1 efflux RND transporter periplasmic adaptor subunit [Shewanella vesiculosa]NCP36096.1 efflux RND transporter periplasmic adaptor subunit [Shewanella vesiculosa]NCP71226.1 efflux RND transporter periplasmic adaptor subunit [Shewanella|tara:strand:+ start:5715 stop:6947 length:1233 start_codon:yes stop_codon:yes gene_type:complete